MKNPAARNRTLRLTPLELAARRAELLVPRGELTVADIDGRLLLGDFAAVAPLLPPAFADLLFLDPPYNLARNFHGRRFHRMSDTGYQDYLESWLPAALRLLKPGGSVYLCGDWRSAAADYTVLSRHATIRNRITWQREKGRGAARNWKNGCEDLWFATLGDAYYFDLDAVKVRRRVLAPYREGGRPKDWEAAPDGNFRRTCPSNFWDDLTVPFWSMPENTDHPTQKPEKLLAKIILASCPPGGMVFDPFFGSGTAAVAAQKLGRRFSGVECNPEYGAWALERLDRARRDPAIQGYADGVFHERHVRRNSTFPSSETRHA